MKVNKQTGPQPTTLLPSVLKKTPATQPEGVSVRPLVVEAEAPKHGEVLGQVGVASGQHYVGNDPFGALAQELTTASAKVDEPTKPKDASSLLKELRSLESTPSIQAAMGLLAKLDGAAQTTRQRELPAAQWANARDTEPALMTTFPLLRLSESVEVRLTRRGIELCTMGEGQSGPLSENGVRQRRGPSLEIFAPLSDRQNETAWSLVKSALGERRTPAEMSDEVMANMTTVLEALASASPPATSGPDGTLQTATALLEATEPSSFRLRTDAPPGPHESSHRALLAQLKSNQLAALAPRAATTGYQLATAIEHLASLPAVHNVMARLKADQDTAVGTGTLPKPGANAGQSTVRNVILPVAHLSEGLDLVLTHQGLELKGVLSVPDKLKGMSSNSTDELTAKVMERTMTQERNGVWEQLLPIEHITSYLGALLSAWSETPAKLHEQVADGLAKSVLTLTILPAR